MLFLRVSSLGDDIECLGDGDVVGEDDAQGELEGEAEEGGAGAGADKEPADSGHQLVSRQTIIVVLIDSTCPILKAKESPLKNRHFIHTQKR